LTPGNYGVATANQMPWNVSADATHIFLTVQATSLSDPKIASVTLPSRATTLLTRYGISYRAADDTFYFYRSDGVTGNVTRGVAGIPTTGQWNLQDWRPIMFSSLTANAESLIQDVALYDNHRTQTQFMAAAGGLIGNRFDYTGTVQTFTVPAGATGIRIECAASVGNDHFGGVSSTAKGGVVTASFPTTPGTVYDVIVGSRFTVFGGGAGGSSGDNGRPGGDYSCVKVQGAALTASLIVAGGGGGENGGIGGYPAGGDGHGLGGTQTAGGLRGADSSGFFITPSTDGSSFQGGRGGGSSGGLDEGGGGGGGGWFGGGGAGVINATNQPGGGGSSHVSAAATDVVYSNGANGGPGYVIFTWW